MNDDGLKGVGKLKNLQWLYLGGSKVTDVGLKELEGLTNLQMLTLSYDKISSARQAPWPAEEPLPTSPH